MRPPSSDQGQPLDPWQDLEATLCGLIATYLLPSIDVSENGLTIYNAAAPSYGVGVGLVWFIPGLALVGSYFLFAYRHIFEKLQTET